jgi:Kef-type K+ transport system membrane component KefB
MNLDSILFELTVIIVGAAALGTLFLYAKQPIIIAYIAIGAIVGPTGIALINRTDHIEQISHFGVILLLFLIGLNLQPAKFLSLFRKTSFLTLSTSLFFGFVSFLFALFLKFDIHNSLLLGASLMFSSTVVGLKLIPTTSLHHKRTGQIMTSILLFQDILAILVILFITGEKSDHVLTTFAFLVGNFFVLCLFSFLGVRFIIIQLFKKFDVIQEYTYLTTLGWCLLWAETAHLLGLSYEIGAFIAGLSIASSKVALVIAEHLKPLREFFLILFFFAVGSKLDFRFEPRLLLASLILGGILVPLKVGVFRLAFKKTDESLGLQKELSLRLAQSSEFSILVAFSALSIGVMSKEVAMVIQITTVVTFIVSTYWVVFKYKTPISGN